VFVVPQRQRYEHKAERESALFSVSDRPAQKALGIQREID
jgi:gentisate 1,2-dioxygenase